MKTSLRFTFLVLLSIVFGNSAFGYYDPRLGRWLSRDPVGEEGGFNLYAYCGNDPVNRHDPIGFDTLSPCAPSNQKITDEIATLTTILNGERDVAFIQNSYDCVGWRPAGQVRWGTPDQWGAVDFLKKVLVARKELSPNNFGTYNTVPVLDRIFGDHGPDIQPYFEPSAGYASSSGMRELFHITEEISAGSVSVSTAFLPGPEELLFTGALGRTRVATAAVPSVAERVAGATGGNWKAINEVVGGANVARQYTQNACGPACGQMLLADRGIKVFQSNIASQTGGVLSSPEGLELSMKAFQNGWRGGYVGPEVFSYLNLSGSWSAMMRGTGSIDHWIVVDGLDAAGRVMIRDPQEGTSYLMEQAEFFEYWNGNALWGPAR